MPDVHVKNISQRKKKNDLAETSHDIEWSIAEIVWLWDTHSKDRKVQNHPKRSMSNKGIVQMIKS